MNFTVKVDQERQILKVDAHCQLNQEIRKEILLIVASRLQIHGLSKVLIDVRQAVFNPTESMINALDLINYMQNIGIKPDVKLAFVYADAEDHRKYFEKMATSEGLKLHYFRDYERALTWLGS